MGCKFGVSVVVVIFDEIVEVGNFFGVFDGVSFYYFGVEFGEEVLVDVKDVGDIIRYIGSEVVVSVVKNDDVVISYVFVIVVINIFNDSGGIGVVDGEMFSSNIMEEGSIVGSII